jgi:hypothetical protein
MAWRGLLGPCAVLSLPRMRWQPAGRRADTVRRKKSDVSRINWARLRGSGAQEMCSFAPPPVRLPSKTSPERISVASGTGEIY